MKTQAEIRSKMLKERAKLSESEVYLKSQIIQNKVLALLQIKDKTTFFVYNAFKNEVDTLKIINELKSQNKTVCFPLIKGEVMYAAKPLSNDFILDKYGIKTPKEYEIIDSVEVVYDYPHYVDDYKYIIPYYVLSGKNKKGESVQITMPAIKNKYLLVR